MCGTIKCGCPSGRTPRFLQPCILLLLYKKPSYGYELMKDLKRGIFLETKPDASAVYGILQKLEKEGSVKSNWITKQVGPAKRIYRMTTKGKKLLNEWGKSIRIKRDILNRFLAEYAKIAKNRTKRRNNQ
jgi:DNA-binding PadR family transcriptional regulator